MVRTVNARGEGGFFHFVGRYAYTKLLGRDSHGSVPTGLVETTGAGREARRRRVHQDSLGARAPSSYCHKDKGECRLKGFSRVEVIVYDSHSWVANGSAVRRFGGQN